MKALAALAIVVAGAVAAFAVYTFRPDEEQSRPADRRGARVYTLQQGDRVVMPSVEVECEATVEGAFPRLFCTRTWNGRYQVEIFPNSVGVYDLEDPDLEPMAPTYSVPAERSPTDR